MSSSSITSILAQSGEIILRWSDSPFAPALESAVELVDSDNSDPIVRAPRRVGEDTPVTLIAKGYTVNGIVRFCRADKQSYLITVSTCEITQDQPDTAHFRDPGALAVNDFLTEEDEAKILESLQDSLRSETPDPAVLLTAWRELMGAGSLFIVRAAQQVSRWIVAVSPVQSLSGLRGSCC